MPHFGLDEKGFKRKRYNDVINEMKSRARAKFGEDINLSLRSPQGLFIVVVAWFIANIWELAEKVYYASFVDFAKGISLDYVCKFIGIKRFPAKKSQGKLTIKGEAGIVVDEGFLISTPDGIKFETIEEKEIEEDGEVIIKIRAKEFGPEGNVSENTITEIIESADGIDEVYNENKTKQGRYKETDDELRRRYKRSVARGGGSTIDNIRATILEQEDVRAAIVIENTKNEEDEDNRPPKSIHAYVLGGDKDDIGESIFNTKAGGIEPYGETEVEVFDLAGKEHYMYFDWAVEVTAYIKITNLNTTAEYPEDGDNKILNNIIEFVGGEAEDGTIYAGLGMGSILVYKQLINTIFEVPGIEDFTLELSTDDEIYNKENITPKNTEVIETDYDKVVIKHD